MLQIEVAALLVSEDHRGVGPGSNLAGALQPPSLIDFHPAVGFTPVIVGLVADADLLSGLADGFPLTQ